MRVVIVQPDLRAYRLPVFDALATVLGWEVTVLFSGRDESIEPTAFARVRVPTLRLRSVFLQWRLTEHMANADVNIVGLDLHWPSALVVGLRHRNSVPLVLWGQGLGGSMIGSLARRWIVSHADRFILYGYRGRAEVIRRGVAPEKTVVAPNTMIVAEPADTSSAPGDYFLYVGRLQPRKRLDLLLRAFAEFRNRSDSSARLIVIGDGDSLSDLQAVARGLNLVRFVEFVPQTTDEKALKNWFESAIAYVSPSAVGLGVLHASAYGVPVITFQSDMHGPEAEWIRHEENGLVVEPTVAAFADAMVRLIEHPGLASTLGRAAYLTYTSAASPHAMLAGFRRAVEEATSSSPVSNQPETKP